MNFANKSVPIFLAKISTNRFVSFWFNSISVDSKSKMGIINSLVLFRIHPKTEKYIWIRKSIWFLTLSREALPQADSCSALVLTGFLSVFLALDPRISLQTSFLYIPYADYHISGEIIVRLPVIRFPAPSVGALSSWQSQQWQIKLPHFYYLLEITHRAWVTQAGYFLIFPNCMNVTFAP